MGCVYSPLSISHQTCYFTNQKFEAVKHKHPRLEDHTDSSKDGRMPRECHAMRLLRTDDLGA